jgi:nicotinamide mononucleotide transporter
MLSELSRQFLSDLRHTGWVEFIAVITGILSVWYSRTENIWVYPTGLINTVAYIFLSFKYALFGEASVNFYYTVLNIYGWYVWTRKDDQKQLILRVTFSSSRDWLYQSVFFAFFYLAVFFALTFIKKGFYAQAIPWADALASAAAYTGMWLMTRKKVESWYWWIITDLASIPLYFVKHLVFTSVYYFILLILAIGGLIEWRRRAKSINYGAA